MWEVIILQYKRQKQKSIENRAGYIKSMISLIMESDGITQAELAHSLEISNPTMIGYLKKLREKELLDESGRLDSDGGRRPRSIRVNGDSHFSVGIHIKPDYYLLAVVNMKNEVKKTRQVDMPFRNRMEYWKDVNDSVNEILEQNGLASRAVGIGISVPCAVRIEENDILFAYSAQIGEINGTRLSQVQPYFDLPLCVEGEAAAAGYRYSVMNGVENLAYLMVNDGIEGAYIQKNEISRGNNGFMGMYGHITIHPDGQECFCGKKGCLEVYCSTDRLREHAGGSLKEYWKLLERKDQEAVKIFDEYLNNMAIGVANILIMMDCSVIIGGEIVDGIEKYASFMDRALRPSLNLIWTQEHFGTMAEIDSGDIYNPAVGAAMMQNMRFMTS